MSRQPGGFEIESAFDIDRSNAEVFAFLADTANFRVVDPALVDYSPTGQLSVGLQGTMAHRRGWMVARTRWTVIECDAPRSLVVEINGSGYGMTEAVTLEPIAGGTRATFVERVWPTSLGGRLLVAASSGIMRRDLKARAERLRAVLEQPVGVPG
jgi:carbon monoxide dehydrogenase subunit G